MDKKGWVAGSYLMIEIIRHADVKVKLDALREHDAGSFNHSVRVCLYSICLGLENEVDSVISLGRSAALHDIGKLHVPKRILQKQGTLSEVERNVMNEHPRWGFFELQSDNYTIERKIAVGHHEYKFGAYPRTDSGKIIVGDAFGKHAERRKCCERELLFNQIVAVADMYDALSSRRSYKPPMSIENTEKIMREQFTGNQKFVDQILLQHCRNWRCA